MGHKKIDSWLAQADAFLFQAESSGKTKVQKLVWHSSRILFAVLRDLFSGSITLHAMSLVYTTLLSIVPFLALSFSVLKGLGVHNQLEPLLLSLAAPLGDQGTEMVANIVGFVDNFKVGVLGSVGLGLLIYTVISLVQKVENSFNQIWRVSQLRSIGQRFSNYLSVIIIGPVLVFSALGTTATFMNSEFVTTLLEITPFGWAFAILSRLTPYLMMVGLFTFLYMFIPNTKVKIKYAFFGGLVGGILWQSIGLVFAKVFTASASSGSYAAIYSGFAIGIVALWWLYLSWLILLLGSAFAFYAQHASQITRSRIIRPSAMVDEHAGLAMVYKVAKHFDAEGGGILITDLERFLSVDPDAVARIRSKLIHQHILMRAGDNNELLIPAKALDKIVLNDVMEVLRGSDDTLPATITGLKAVTHITHQLKEAQSNSLSSLTIGEWVRGKVKLVEPANDIPPPLYSPPDEDH